MRVFAYVVGTRPNLMKTAPVLEAMRQRAPGDRHVLIHTGILDRRNGQHAIPERWDGRAGERVAAVIDAAVSARINGRPSDGTFAATAFEPARHTG